MKLLADLLKNFRDYLSYYEIVELSLTINKLNELNASFCAKTIDKTYDKNIDALKRYFEDNLKADVILKEEDIYFNVFNTEYCIRVDKENLENQLVCFRVQIIENKTLTVIKKCSVYELISVSKKILNAMHLYLHSTNLKTKLELVEYDEDDYGFFFSDFMHIKTTKTLKREDILDEKIASLKKELETTTEETAGRMYSDAFLENAIALLKAEKTYHENLTRNIDAEWYISELLEEVETITTKQGFEMYTKGYYLRLKINKAAEESIAKMKLDKLNFDYGQYI